MRLSKLRANKMALYVPSPLPALIPISSAFLLSLCILRELVQVFRVCFVLHSSREVSNKPYMLLKGKTKEILRAEL